MDNSAVKSLVDDIQPENIHLTDNYGKTIKVQDYIEQYRKIISAKQDARVIPNLFEAPLGVQLELTHSCNQKCIHCYNQSGIENNSTPDLSVEEWKNIAQELGNMGVFQCVISGGEPTLLGDDLFEIMDIFHNHGATFVVISNGMLINEANIKRFSKYNYNWFQISIDGSRPEIHDHIRGVESFKKAIHAANLIKQEGIPLVIAHTVMKHNKDYFEEMLDLAYILGAKRIAAGPFSYMGRAVLNSKDIELTDEEIKEVYKTAEAKFSEYEKLTEISISMEEAISLRIKLSEPNSTLLIRPNGDVKFDCISPFKIGNTRENTLQEIWKRGRVVHAHPRMIEYVSQIKSYRDLLTVSPIINVDPDEMLIFKE